MVLDLRFTLLAAGALALAACDPVILSADFEAYTNGETVQGELRGSPDGDFAIVRDRQTDPLINVVDTTLIGGRRAYRFSSFVAGLGMGGQVGTTFVSAPISNEQVVEIEWVGVSRSLPIQFIVHRRGSVSAAYLSGFVGDTEFIAGRHDLGGVPNQSPHHVRVRIDGRTDTFFAEATGEVFGTLQIEGELERNFATSAVVAVTFQADVAPVDAGGGSQEYWLDELTIRAIEVE